MRVRVFAVVAVLVLGLGMQPAQAINAGTATFLGNWTFAPPAPLAVPGPSFLTMVTAGCINAGVHPLEPKATADAGACFMTFGGAYAGNCFAGTMPVAVGWYTDSAAQVHPITVSVVISFPVWTMTGTITKGPLAGTIAGGGRWGPLPVGLGCPTAISDGVVNYTV